MSFGGSGWGCGVRVPAEDCVCISDFAGRPPGAHPTLPYLQTLAAPLAVALPDLSHYRDRLGIHMDACDQACAPLPGHLSISK